MIGSRAISSVITGSFQRSSRSPMRAALRLKCADKDGIPKIAQDLVGLAESMLYS